MADGDRKGMTLEDWRSVVQVRWPPDRQPVDADRPETAVEHSPMLDPRPSPRERGAGAAAPVENNAAGLYNVVPLSLQCPGAKVCIDCGPTMDQCKRTATMTMETSYAMADNFFEDAADRPLQEEIAKMLRAHVEAECELMLRCGGGLPVYTVRR